MPRKQGSLSHDFPSLPAPDTTESGESDPQSLSTEFIPRWIEGLQASIEHHKRSSRWHRRQMRSAVERLSKVLEDCERLGIETNHNH